MSDDRSAVVTTLNGRIVDWRVFEDSSHAMNHYVQEVGRLRDFLQRSPAEDAWEIMLCDVRQYALSKPRGDRRYTKEEVDWYSRSKKVVANQARRMKDFRPQWSKHLWNHSDDRRRARSQREEELLKTL
ncbi:MAG: hypothetical protein GX369_06100 [Euryarchaeota archaeon]|nr:hypothetical protein [Euryarchaeota archaeon]